jgi:uncharacterized protein
MDPVYLDNSLMATQIIIDGYNLMWGTDVFRAKTLKNFEGARDHLLETLAKTPTLLGKTVTVVFDAWKTDSLAPSRELYKSITVIYSQKGQKADELIKKLAEKHRGAAVVVSSDRDVRRVCEKKGCSLLYSSEFERMIRQGDTTPDPLMALKGYDPQEETAPPKGTQKKGPAKRLPRTRRRARSRLLKT